jgi:hypothetical protein
MKNTVRVKIYTSFGKKYVIYFPSTDAIPVFETEINNSVWITIYPIGSNAKVKLTTNSIMALEIFKEEERENDREEVLDDE